MPAITVATQLPAIVDGKSLGVVGLIYGAVTAGVVLIASVLVQAHVDGRLSLDEASHQAIALSSAGR
jgi:hypothetical protein